MDADSMDEEDFFRIRNRRRRGFLYGSFLLCLLGAALVSAALGTRYWFVADVSNPNDVTRKGNFNTGLFEGNSVLQGLAYSNYTYYTVCVEGWCMFSCGATDADRKDNLRLVLDGLLNDTKLCPSDVRTTNRGLAARELPVDVEAFSVVDYEADYNDAEFDKSENVMDVKNNTHSVDKELRRDADSASDELVGDLQDMQLQGLLKSVLSVTDDEETDVNMDSATIVVSDTTCKVLALVEQMLGVVPLQTESLLRTVKKKCRRQDGLHEDLMLKKRGYFKSPLVKDGSEWLDSSVAKVEDDGSQNSSKGTPATDGLLSQGLWAGTIGCLAAGLLFAVLGALFAVINTATTPVEAIAGIPGLYIWNGLAALFELVAVVCWAVQFSTHLSSNVLIVDSRSGWTTEGHEKLGYSFWLVVVSIVVHLANCALIGFGTYEPKVKEKIQEPDKATNDIMLF